MPRVGADAGPAAWVRLYGELNDFLPPELRGREVVHPVVGSPPVKDLIESLGVPHVEVDLILVGDRSVDFAARVGPGDRIAVYPPFRSLDVSPLRRIERRPAGRTFVLDGHLGRLARLLRLLGLDALHANGYRDDELAQLARREGRILLTRDRELLKRSVVEHGYWVRSSEPLAQAREVLLRFGLRGSVAPFTRCLLCNGLLHGVTKEEVQEEVPPRVAAWREVYLRCRGCGKVYWEGTHYPRLQDLVNRILAT